MDDCDIAQEKMDVLLRHDVAVRKPSGPLATGACLFCEEELPEGMRWCDASCRDLWERLKKGA